VALKRRWRIGLAAALLLCSATAQAVVAIVDDRGRRVELPAPPQRVVSLLPSLTETMCALQALRGCERLVGVDRFSTWPARVRSLPMLGGLEDTQIERLVALKPDLVLASGSSRAIDRLEALGLRVVALEHKNLQDTERVILRVALLLGDESAGAALWRQLQGRIEAAAARVPPALRGHKVYFEIAATPYAAGASSFVGETLALLGLANIVPASMGPFPQLNPEFVVRAQPELVLASARALAEMPRRPGWAGLRALREGRACGFDSERWDVLVRPGPRLGEAAEIVADCLQGLPR
jgi:iron complex transport system substrate-binding protein